jgi:hypothetical protein
MSETLKVTNQPISKLEIDADDMKSSCGNEDYYTYNFLNHVHLSNNKESGSMMNYNETDDLSKVIYECLHSRSHIYESDCSDESRKLAGEYRQKLMSH